MSPSTARIPPTELNAKATVQDANQLVAWLVEQVLPEEPREEHVREAATERCRALRIEPPSSGRIDWLVRSAFHTFEERWCASVFDRLDVATQRALEDLLLTGGADDDSDAEATETRRSRLNELKADADAISLESVLAEIAKLERMRRLGLPTDWFRDVSLNRHLFVTMGAGSVGGVAVRATIRV